jgi:hypothetical protein
MGDKNIKKEVKKKKKSDSGTAPSVVLKSVVAQPEVIKKEKKIK